jgi:hypothetical protein
MGSHDYTLILVIAIGTICVAIKQLRPSWPVYRYMALVAVALLFVSVLAIVALLEAGKYRGPTTDQQLAANIQNVLPPILAQRDGIDKKVEADWENARNLGAENPAMIQEFSQMLKVHDDLTQCRRELQALATFDDEFATQLEHALRHSPGGDKITPTEIVAIRNEFPIDTLRDLDKAKDCSAVFLLSTCDILMMTRGQWYVSNNQVIFNDPKTLAEYNNGMASYKQSLEVVNLVTSKLREFSTQHPSVLPASAGAGLEAR